MLDLKDIKDPRYVHEWYYMASVTRGLAGNSEFCFPKITITCESKVQVFVSLGKCVVFSLGSFTLTRDTFSSSGKTYLSQEV